MISKEQLEILVNKRYSIIKIAKEFNLSPTSIRYALRKYGLTTFRSHRTTTCIECGAALKTNQYKYCSQVCSTKVNNSNKYQRNKKEYNKNSYLRQYRIGRERKLKLINIFGGKCQKCGYNKNFSALSFHHLDSENKNFGIDLRKCSNTNWKSLVEEASKCMLLCLNCHAEIHYPKNIMSTTKVGPVGFEPTL